MTVLAATVADAMVTIPKTHPPDVTLDAIRKLFEDDHVRLVLIVAGDRRLVTTIEREDILTAWSSSARVATLGTLAGRTARPFDSLAPAVAKLERQRGCRLAVIDDDGRLMGLLCLKRDRAGFCTDGGIRARERGAVGCTPDAMALEA
jgi:CBS domain-containing protein